MTTLNLRRLVMNITIKEIRSMFNRLAVCLVAIVLCASLLLAHGDPIVGNAHEALRRFVETAA